jgi:hypothetical protein
VVAAALGVGMATVAAAPLRDPALRAAGQVLVADDHIAPADVVVISVGADGAGVLEAADLVQAGVAGRVAVFADPPDPVVDREFLRRGVPYEDAAARSIRQLGALGIANIERIPRGVAGTEDEARILPGWCEEKGFRSVVVVTTADHSRRLRRLLGRSLKGRATRVTVRPARYSPFDPARWWETREGIRTQVIETEKLALDVLLHPIP